MFRSNPKHCTLNISKKKNEKEGKRGCFGHVESIISSTPISIIVRLRVNGTTWTRVGLKNNVVELWSQLKWIW